MVALFFVRHSSQGLWSFLVKDVNFGHFPVARRGERFNVKVTILQAILVLNGHLSAILHGDLRGNLKDFFIRPDGSGLFDGIHPARVFTFFPVKGESVGKRKFLTLPCGMPFHGE